jgi:hypothetical protein
MFRRCIAILLILTLALPLPLHAEMVTTERALGPEQLATLLERPEVQAQLEAYGVSVAEVEARIAALTDAEAAALAARIDELPAGGVGIVGAIVVVFLVLLLTDILGYTKVFPFTRPIQKK